MNVHTRQLYLLEQNRDTL